MQVFKKPRLGFTLSEFVVSLTILGLIAALTIPSFITSVEERKRLATFRESLLLVEGVLKKYCASPGYGTTVFYEYFVANVRQVQNSSTGTATTNTTVTFRNGSRVTIDPTSNQIVVQWISTDTADSVTLNYNPFKGNDLLVNGRALKACEVAPLPAQRGLYAQALGLRINAAPAAEYVGDTSQLINPADVVVTNTNAGGATVDSGHQYGARNNGFT
jgi:prepilin-type N-terminal cleavage/methylation domain-containing protein